MSGGEVDDAEAAHAEADFPLREDAVVVRTAVGDDVAHPSQDDGIDVRVPAELKYPRNATHTFSSQPNRLAAGNPKLPYGIKKLEITDQRLFLKIALGGVSKSGTVCPFETFNG